MNYFDAFLNSIYDGDLRTFSRNYSDQFINKVYKHNMENHGIIKLEMGSRNGHLKLRPIHLACARGHYEIVKQLILLECDLEATSKIGNTPMHIVASTGHWEILVLLIKQGCSLEVTNKWKRTPLHVAAESDELKVAKALLYAGSDTEQKDSMNLSAEQLADLCGNNTVATAIREWRKFNELLKLPSYGRFKDILEHSSFKKFYINNDVCIESLAEYLVTVDVSKPVDVVISDLRLYHYIRRHQDDDWLMHADIEAVNRILNEESALVYCLNIADSCPYIVNHLIQLILDLDRMEEKLIKIYQIVTKLTNRNITGMISKRQDFVHVKIKALWNRLHLAVSDGRCDLIEYLLLKQLADVDGTDEVGNTPLFLACIYGRIDCAKLLVIYGADINTTNKYGQNLVHVAIENGMEDFIKPILHQIRSVDHLDIRTLAIEYCY